MSGPTEQERVLEAILREFIRDINNTGGLIRDPSDCEYHSPVADPDWGDLAMTYLKACKALGVAPLFNDGSPDDEEPVKFCKFCAYILDDDGNCPNAACSD